MFIYYFPIHIIRIIIYNVHILFMFYFYLRFVIDLHRLSHILLFINK